MITVFKVNYRILDKDKEQIKSLYNGTFQISDDVEGFFSVEFNNAYYGHYHNGPLAEGEEGWDHIGQRFESYLLAYEYLTDHNSVAVVDNDTPHTAVFLKRTSDSLTACVVRTQIPNGTQYLLDKPGLDTDIVEWSDMSVGYQTVSFSQFASEIIDSAKQYVQDLLNLNPMLVNNNIVGSLIKHSTF